MILFNQYKTIFIQASDVFFEKVCDEIHITEPVTMYLYTLFKTDIIKMFSYMIASPMSIESVSINSP